LIEIVSNVNVQMMPQRYGRGCRTSQTASHTYISYKFKVFEDFILWWMGIRCKLRPFPPSQLFLGLGKLAERVGDNVSAKMINNTTSLWLRLQKPFKLHPTSI
jgi:hypothetical protein